LEFGSLKQIHASVLARLLIIFGTLLLGLFVSSTSASSSPSSSWFETPFSPTLSQEGTIPRGGLNNVNSLNLGGKCDDEVMLTRDFYPSWALWRQTVNSCWRNSSAGLISEGSNPYLIAKDDYIAGRVQNLNTLSTLTPTPDDFVILEQKGGSGSYKKLHYKPSLSTTRSITGSVTHTLSAQDTFTLKWENGQNASNVSDVGFSSNGRWMVGTTVNTSLFRVDVKTKKILSFGEPIQQSSGWNPFMKVSITDDGNYAVATGTAHAGNQWMRLYDLGDCQDDEKDYIANQHANCKYIDLTDYLRQNIPNFNRFSMAKFGDNNTLVFYHIPAGANDKLQKYLLRAPGTDTGTKSYVAMGDSFASGEGTYRYFKGTDEGENINGCHLSDKSYPYLIGKDLGMNKNDYFSVACSGAKIRNINGKRDFIDNTLNPNLRDEYNQERTNQYLGPDQVSNNSLGNLLPGYKRQIEFAHVYKPDAMTLSIIGNDIGFGKKLATCLMPETCYNTYEDRLAILREVRSKFNDLVDLYKQILDQSNGKTKLYVVGYPKFANPDGNCALNVGMEYDELVFGNQTVAQLNDVIRSAANKAGVVYVDIEDVFRGQALCEGKHLAFNGLSKGEEQLLGLIGKESFHPNQIGHRLIRNAIWEQTNQLTKPMPGPNETITAPAQEDDLDFLNKPKTNQSQYNTYYTDGMTTDIIYKQNNTNISAGDIQNFFKPNSSVEIVIRSDPVRLATVNANIRGYVDTTIQIPDSIPTGIHTINLLGQDLEGNNINLQKIVYVAESENDKNGNGVVDSSEPCGALPYSSVDEDGDSIDDACDPDIGEAPTPPQGPSNPTQPVSQSTDTAKTSDNPLVSSSMQPAINPMVSGLSLTDQTYTSDETSLQTQQKPSNSPHPEVLGDNSTNIDSTPSENLPQTNQSEQSYWPQLIMVTLILFFIFALVYRIRYANR
jgi:hypothetical protein